MLTVRSFGSTGPSIVLLHWLGGSGQTWTEVAQHLARRGFHCHALDLPGFGDSPRPEFDSAAAGYTVDDMATAVLSTVRSLSLTGPWLLAGHSMGGKVAMCIARSLADSTQEGISLPTLAGLILVSPSPPAPEPMKDSQRAHLLDTLGRSTGDAAQDRDYAAAFVADNVGKLPLEPDVCERTVADVLRMSRPAFTAWLEHGSKEDLAARIRVLPQPAVVLAGTEEPALGPEAQHKLTLPHFAPDAVELIPMAASGHLSPLERPVQLAGIITDFGQRIGVPAQPSYAALPPAWAELLGSPRTSPQTREVLTARLAADTPSQIFNAAEDATLRALVDCVVPEPGIDLAARVTASLNANTSDGWRFDDLPADLAAWHTGLASLDAAAQREHGVDFIALSATQQQAMLAAAQNGDLGARGLLGSLGIGSAASLFNAQQMLHWFEDVRAELAKLYVADPRTMARIGFNGFADGTESSSPDSGFNLIQLNQREAFELPATITDGAAQ